MKITFQNGFLEVIMPDGSIYHNWDYDISSNYKDENFPQEEWGIEDDDDEDKKQYFYDLVGSCDHYLLKSATKGAGIIMTDFDKKIKQLWEDEEWESQ